jgi:dipeptidyl-peptidase-4
VIAPPPAPDDPFLRQLAETRGFRAGRPTAIQLAPDGKAALFLRSGPRSRVQSLLETDLATGATRELVSPAALAGAEAPTAAEAARLERQRITARGVTHFELSPDGSRIALPVGGRVLLLDRRSGALRPLAPAVGVLDPRFSPDGRALAYVKDRDLHVVDLATSRERRLTRARGAELTNGLAEFVAQEEMDRDEGYWWSPDSRRLAYAEVDTTPVEKWALCDPARPERGCTFEPYPRAGKANARVRLLVVPSAGGKPVAVRWDREAFPYLATVRWEKGAPLVLLVQDRAQQVQRLLAADPDTGATRLLLEERDPDFLTLDQDFPVFRADGSFYWRTERNGGPEVELRAADGRLVRSVVAPALGFVELAGHDRAADLLVFTAAPDPTQTVLHRVRSGGPPEPLAAGDDGPALRTAELSERGGAVAVTWSTLRRMPRSAVFTVDGARLAELPSVAEEPPFEPTTELRKVGPGEGLWTSLVRPRASRAAVKLPVVLEVYGGPSAPGVVHAPQLWAQWLADQGFLVVEVDGRGTLRRGRAFSRAIRGDFSEKVLDDQVTGLRGVAAEVPALDLDRVGASGWSFGGWTAAMAVLRRPDVFKAAVAGAPVAEWRDYDTHYTERYLGLPDENAAGYDRSSLLTWAPGLSRPLLVIHGTADDNVYFTHSLKLADALFRAGRPFELAPVAGATHMLPEPITEIRKSERTAEFLRRHLGVAPKADGTAAAASGDGAGAGG